MKLPIRITRHIVESSNVRTIGYSPRHKVLEVEFRNNSIYRYYLVPFLYYEQLLLAMSLGQSFHRLIKEKNYPYRRIL